MVNLKELARFLVKAKKNTYAGDGEETVDIDGCKKLEFSEGDWHYRDVYAGFYYAPGKEIVFLKERPVWAMAYNGGMLEEYHNNLEFAKQTYAFLKEALKKVEEQRPLRGPEHLKEEDFEYIDSSEGNIKSFKGTEKILYRGEIVYKQDYIGGLIIPK